MSNRTRYERETSITYNEEEQEAIVWTCMQQTFRKMDKLGIKPFRNDGEGKAFKVPKKWIKISFSNRKPLSEEQKEILRVRLKSKVRLI